MFHTDITTSLNLLDWGLIFFLFIGMLSHVLVLILVSWRFQIMVRKMRSNISVYNSTLITFFIQLTSYFVPFKLGGMITKPIILKKILNINLKKSIFITFFEQFYENIWQLLFLPIFILLAGKIILLDQVISSVYIGIILVMLLILTLKFRKRLVVLIFKIITLLPNFVKKLIKKMGLGEEEIPRILEYVNNYINDLRFIIRINIVTLMFVLIAPMTLASVFYIFNISFPYLQLIPLYWIAAIVGKFSGIPGGLGSRDIILFGFIKIVTHTNSSLIIQMLILYRIILIVPTLILGIYAYLSMGKKILNDIKQQKFK